MGDVLRIGSRASRLALRQAESVAQGLRQAWPNLEVRIETIRTMGEKRRATPLGQLPGAGFFVKELEAALLDDRIDLVVHSMKDVPTRLAPALEVEASVPPRADVRDCLVTAKGLALKELPEGATVGTGSPRRRAMLLSVRPDLAFVDLRGNVETRVRKLEQGVCDATVLARAGVGRLGILDGRMVALEPSVMLPAAGQGALGLEFRSEEETVRRWVAPLDDPPSRWAVVAERALVRRLGAGCRTALGVLAQVNAGGMLTLAACLVSPDGRKVLRREAAGAATEAAAIGDEAARQLRDDGAGRFLKPAGGQTHA